MLKNQPRLSLGQSIKVQSPFVETCGLCCAMVILPPAGTLCQTRFLVDVQYSTCAEGTVRVHLAKLSARCGSKRWLSFVRKNVCASGEKSLCTKLCRLLFVFFCGL